MHGTTEIPYMEKDVIIKDAVDFYKHKIYFDGYVFHRPSDDHAGKIEIRIACNISNVNKALDKIKN